MIQEKFVCPFCGFESNGSGLCPSCDENLQKVCNCGSGKYSADCCMLNQEPDESEKLIKAEVASETLKELAEKEEKELKEEEELSNVKEVDEE
ncbi:MAG: hypothetical protein NTZ49_00355 [Candidatus Parcubacteria bacterium]|nr:hypothetical protein [Candidatus Parcubacteria bacterium]